MASALDTARAKFVVGLSKLTGLDPRVLVAWTVQEGDYAPNGTGGFNFLNLRPKTGGTSYSGVPLAGVSSGNFAQFNNAADAATETAYWLNNMPNYSGIRAAAGKGTPATQIAAIAASPWDQSHYGGMGGINLKNTFVKLFSLAGLTDKALGPDAAAGVANTAGSGSAADAGSYDAKNAANALKSLNPFTSWTKWINDHAAYGGVYALLVLFAMFLAVMGVLAMLGIHPGTVARTMATAAAA